MSSNITKKKASLKDIAKAVGVSPSLVSFVLNGKSKQYRVGEEVSKEIIKMAAEMNYQPNNAAKSLRSGKSNTLGVVVSDISNPFFSAIARYIEDFAGRRGYTVFFCSSDEDAGKMERLVMGLQNRGVDGVIIVPCENSEQTIANLVGTGFPVVLLDRYFEKINSNYVAINNFEASYNAVQYLIERNYRNIGMVAYDVQLSHMQERVRGYKAAMIDNGLADCINVKFAEIKNIRLTTDAIISDMINIMKVDALFFATNTIAIECLRRINEHKVLNIPADLGLIGFDGGDAFDFFYAPLTFVRQPLELLAKNAIDVLIEAIENKNREIQQVDINSELIVRKSTR